MRSLLRRSINQACNLQLNNENYFQFHNKLAKMNNHFTIPSLEEDEPEDFLRIKSGPFSMSRGMFWLVFSVTSARSYHDQ